MLGWPTGTKLRPEAAVPAWTVIDTSGPPGGVYSNVNCSATSSGLHILDCFHSVTSTVRECSILNLNLPPDGQFSSFDCFRVESVYTITSIRKRVAEIKPVETWQDWKWGPYICARARSDSPEFAHRSFRRFLSYTADESLGQDGQPSCMVGCEPVTYFCS